MAMKNIFLLVCLCFVSVTAGVAHAEESCSLSTCHRSLKGLKNMHRPVAEVRCLDCHKQTGNHPFGGKATVTLIEKPPSLCFRCHNTFPVKKTVHSPVQKGTCTACHNPHGAAGPFLIDADPGQTGFCTKCHQPEMFQRKYVHPPVAEGKCTACHDPHQADSPALLREKVPKLCLACHAKVMQKLDSAAVVHPPVKEGRCLGCHDPHSSSDRYLLKGEPGKFCISCHGKIGKTVSSAKSRHAPVENAASCLSCHSGHTSAVKGLLPVEGKTFCLGCHTRMAASLEGKKLLHGPIMQGKCTPCHDPHGSSSIKLLKGDYPETLYVPYQKDKNQYAFCLKCHQKNLLTFPDTTIYTKFRDGKKNLHFIHVSNKKKGRTCRLCHDPHATDSNHLLRDPGMDFGEWRVPLRFEESASGGKCSPGCHGTFSYQLKATGTP